MRVGIYQIDVDRDRKALAFRSYNMMMRETKGIINEAIYDKVYEGDVDAKNLEDVYVIFNINKPENYHGRSLSVSDVIEIDGENAGFYYCDSIGFKNIQFNKYDAYDETEINTIKVLMVKPGERAYVSDIGTKLKDMQDFVDGYIEPYYPFNEDVCIICNEEAKIEGMDLNRGITNDNGELIDIVAGNFFICGYDAENFLSLTDEQIEKYLKKFKYAERFYSINNKIISEKIMED